MTGSIEMSPEEVNERNPFHRAMREVMSVFEKNSNGLDSATRREILSFAEDLERHERHLGFAEEWRERRSF